MCFLKKLCFDIILFVRKRIMRIGLIIATEEEFDTLVQGFNVQPNEEKDVYHKHK